MPDFEREQVDLVVGFSLPVSNPDDIVQRSMSTTHYVLCASPAYFAENGKPETLEALPRHQYISHTGRQQDYIKLQPSYKVALTPYLLVNSVTSMIDCALAGLGLIQLPIYMVQELLAEEKLIAVLPDYQRSGEHIYYYYPKYRYVQTKVRKFIDFFL